MSFDSQRPTYRNNDDFIACTACSQIINFEVNQVFKVRFYCLLHIFNRNISFRGTLFFARHFLSEKKVNSYLLYYSFDCTTPLLMLQNHIFFKLNPAVKSGSFGLLGNFSTIQNVMKGSNQQENWDAQNFSEGHQLFVVHFLLSEWKRLYSRERKVFRHEETGNWVRNETLKLKFGRVMARIFVLGWFLDHFGQFSCFDWFSRFRRHSQICFF